MIIFLIIGATIFLNHDEITIDNLVIKETTNTTYEIKYNLHTNKEYNILDCECSLLNKKGEYLGYGKNIFENVKPDNNLIVTCKATIKENQKDIKDLTPSKIKINIYDQKFDSTLKNQDGTFIQQPIFSKTIEI